MKLRKTNLDEQQERKLLEIESRGCWLVFWGLFIAVLVETLAMDDIRAFGGELVLLMGLALYLVISCVRAGIWDRRLDMSRKTCLLGSLSGGLCLAVYGFAHSYMRSHRPLVALCSGVIGGLIVFALIYFTLRLAARATKKRQDALNAEPEEEDMD